ncbi:DUF5060 domain-containing protein [Zobellia nedashkovskayae]
MKKHFLYLIACTFLLISCTEKKKEEKLTEYQRWHTVTLSFEGPETSEKADDNPFLNYRLNVEFTNGDKTYEVRGFYAADGDAAESSAEKR